MNKLNRITFLGNEIFRGKEYLKFKGNINITKMNISDIAKLENHLYGAIHPNQERLCNLFAISDDFLIELDERTISKKIKSRYITSAGSTSTQSEIKSLIILQFLEICDFDIKNFLIWSNGQVWLEKSKWNKIRLNLYFKNTNSSLDTFEILSQTQNLIDYLNKDEYLKIIDLIKEGREVQINLVNNTSLRDAFEFKKKIKQNQNIIDRYLDYHFYNSLSIILKTEINIFKNNEDRFLNDVKNDLFIYFQQNREKYTKSILGIDMETLINDFAKMSNNNKLFNVVEKLIYKSIFHYGWNQKNILRTLN